MDNSQNKPNVKTVANAVAQEFESDVLLYNGPIERPYDQVLIDLCTKRNRNKNVILILVTDGGEPEAAYRIARCLQEKYEKFGIFIPGYCKSAGTLVALGANSLVMSDSGELGPLDIQLKKPDELWELRSGLTVNEALKAFEEKAFEMFENYFLNIQEKSGGRITLKTAIFMSSSLVEGLLKPIYDQIDPMHVGETYRMMNIARDYGRRLKIRGQNFSESSLTILIKAYPSHGFVIDRSEANALFLNVFKPNENLTCLEELLAEKARYPIPHLGRPIIEYHSDEVVNAADVINERETKNEGDGKDSQNAA